MIFIVQIWENRELQSLEGEIWAPAAGFEEKYEISNFGRVKSLRRKVRTWNGYKTLPCLIMAQGRRNGYLACQSISVHRIVAETFIENPEQKKYVNHKDGVRTNNRADNLEWVTAGENTNHAWATGLCNNNTRAAMSKKASMRKGVRNSCWRGYVCMYGLDGVYQFSFETLKTAEAWLRENTKWKKADKGNISLVCNGKLNHVYGFVFKYQKELT